MREIKANFSITGEYIVNLMAEDHEAPNKESVNRKIVMQKIDKKLKMVELQLKKLKIDKTGKDDGPIEESDGFVISDRNELMKKLLKKD